MSDDDPFLASLSTTRPAQPRDGRNGGRQGGRNGGRGSTDGSRVPPHNLPAEEAVLGALLLSREALGAVIEAGLRYDDFYKPAHQHIYDVAVSVSQSGGPADTITVADELQRLGLLEAVGGVETLHHLQNATPAISNAGHYAKIVADAAMLRRLIMVAGEISEIAYSGPDNVDQALDEAETKVFKVADRRVSDTYAEIGELMKGAIERIEENYARGDTITGIPTGYQDLDELLSGLQPSTLNIIGARPAMGKTAFGLGMATNVAKVSGKAVLVFSLEMGHIELTQRILSSEAEVDSTKIRNGKLSESDWARIGRAIGRLEVPLYLDDNPRVTVMEIRAKARRLKMQKGDLGLILIDYLQLMSGGGNAENRQLEVSEISRNLKILARELEVPIVALSQLSRNLEARADKKPMLSDLRESGCLTASTRLLRADTNTEITLGELVDTGALDVPVWSLDDHYRMVPATLTHAFPSGVKRVFRLRMASGRTVDATGNHRFRTVDGWASLDELHVGARLAVPRLLGAPEHVTPMSPGDLARHAAADGVGAEVFALPTAQVAQYLRRRWDLARRAGCAVVEPGVRISLECSGAVVADHLQQLLLRLAVRSTIHVSDAGHVTLRVRGLDGHRRFVADVVGGGAPIPDAGSDDENDTVPGSADGRRGESSRGRLAELADVLGDKELADLATSDVVWDRIVGIDDVGIQEVFDATVLATHNFVANGVVAHNSLEQDADVVMFLYRDEVYNKESPDRGAADLIVAKHRAGPIGDMRLVFRGQYARFDNAAPRSMG
ncbi:replicative DNA helicase [Desertimonas flava]|uniref:replicative DNA helicase n=1 Tax=Desertimonas flava TaxID=2064846 RepID=UPI0013C43B78|nr:replicative DNA helicase [Desertimonas flava]